MRSSTKKGGRILPPLFGAFLGYLVFHPYTMVVYGLYGHHGTTAEGMDLGHLHRLEALNKEQIESIR